MLRSWSNANSIMEYNLKKNILNNIFKIYNNESNKPKFKNIEEDQSKYEMSSKWTECLG